MVQGFAQKRRLRQSNSVVAVPKLSKFPNADIIQRASGVI
jgi:hypothetical protein